jgi:hypothetical protein
VHSRRLAGVVIGDPDGMCPGVRDVVLSCARALQGTMERSAREVSSMGVNPVRGDAPLSTGPAEAHTSVARWAVGVAAAVAAVILVAGVVLVVAYATGGAAATEDNWVGFLAAVAVIGGLPASLAAFILAVVARGRREQWALLWLPLALFPALLAFVVLGELFWWE